MAIEHAVYRSVVQVLLNLSETIISCHEENDHLASATFKQQRSNARFVAKLAGVATRKCVE